MRINAVGGRINTVDAGVLLNADVLKIEAIQTDSHFIQGISLI